MPVMKLEPLIAANPSRSRKTAKGMPAASMPTLAGSRLPL